MERIEVLPQVDCKGICRLIVNSDISTLSRFRPPVFPLFLSIINQNMNSTAPSFNFLWRPLPFLLLFRLSFAFTSSLFFLFCLFLFCLYTLFLFFISSTFCVFLILLLDMFYSRIRCKSTYSSENCTNKEKTCHPAKECLFLFICLFAYKRSKYRTYNNADSCQDVKSCFKIQIGKNTGSGLKHNHQKNNTYDNMHIHISFMIASLTPDISTQIL